MNILSYADLKEIGIDLSKPQLWRLERQGKFPKRIRISRQRHGWDADEIREWIEMKKAERCHG